MSDWKRYISSDPKILFGKPTIKNSRIAVDLILEKLAVGDSTDALIESYPGISKDEISACLLFAADYIKNEIFIPVAS